ncbi:hypothetical protein ZYGR_0H03680 [Zygosaccharomyces rouxii]|uniref:ZYRO0B12474p n=2 Tax=Zygosaccharomyces rouxii TaxID=4956 RepID=C5DRZ1_ZYGRC|nr:uncharacterized protein ZYRO0B12474g [Zygosaccharomyces rouxii]KAH9199917.1 ATPase assembly factor ATP10 [Zygosaccharomyces rouxii]GAV47523.1 hypothetical protein ZYGR_0H03680 [Zygosaccharomyces rouxii]CAR26552.1 ZYRO0B12474p [Zygosaccharomyces rouxii]
MRSFTSGFKSFSTHSTQSFFKKFYQDVVDVAPKEFKLEELKRPIGLAQPPSKATVYSRGNSFRDLFDREKTNKRSKELGLEFSKSGMYDIHIFRKTNGKLFTSPPSYWRSDKSLYFPHITGLSLKDGQVSLEDTLRGKVSVVRLFSSKVGDDLCKQYLQNDELKLNYLEPSASQSLQSKGIQTVDVNFVDSGIKYALMKLFIGRLRSAVPAYRHSHYLLADREQLPFNVRETLQINNVYTGFTIVVDPALKIRWMASGSATTDEFKTLWKCVKRIREESFH